MLSLSDRGGRMFLSFVVFAAALLQADALPAPPEGRSEVLGAGRVSQPDRYEYCSTLSSDRRTLYIGIEHGEWQSLESYRWKDGAWSEPEHVLGSPDYNAHDPYLSEDEQRLYFITRARGSADIAYLLKGEDGTWGDPIFLSEPINGPANDYYTSLTRSGDLYFSSNRSQESQSYDIYAARLEGDADPVRLPDPINTRAYEGDPFIDPDGRYLIFASNRRGGLGRGDLYLTIADGEGGWSDPIPFDERVNTSGHELCPLVSLDGSAFMFTSNQDIRWMSTSIIEEMIEAHSRSTTAD